MPAEHDATAPKFWLAVLAAFSGYVFLPHIALKFASLGTVLWLTLRAMNGRLRRDWLVTTATACFAAAFLITPVSRSLEATTWPDGPQFATVSLQVALVLAGALWLWLASPSASPVQWRWRASGGAFLALWLGVLLAFHFAAWQADTPHYGDEFFHMSSVSENHSTWRNIRWHPLLLVAAMVWMGAGFYLGRRWQGCSPTRVVLAWAAAGLAIAGALSLWCYPDLREATAEFHKRTLRYPTTQLWLATLLGAGTVESWGRGLTFSFEVLRVLPMLAVFATGLLLAGDARWRDRNCWWTVLAVAGLTSCPAMLFHGTLLYLELGTLPLLVLVLRDSRGWLFGSFARLAGRPAWWAAVSLGFMKDTGIIAAGCLWLARMITLAVAARRRPRHLTRTRLWSEARLSVALLGPGLIYLGLRALPGHRPYQPHFENLLRADLWWQAVSAWAVQFGAGLIFAVAGAVWLWWARRRAMVVLATALFLGLGLFHYCEDPLWIGYPRFNLLLFPSVLVLGWEGATWLIEHRPRAAGLIFVAVLTANLLMNPLSPGGERGPWSHAWERTYRFTECLQAIREQSPRPRILIGNMEVAYAIRLVCERIDWRPQIRQLAPQPGLGQLEDVQTTLRLAAEQGFDFVIYRHEGELPATFPPTGGNFVLFREFSSPGGGLLVFERAR